MQFANGNTNRILWRAPPSKSTRKPPSTFALPLRLRPTLALFTTMSIATHIFGSTILFSRDWVRETEIVRKQFAEQNPTTNTYVLLTEVHIPQDNTEPRADSTFTVLAVRRASSVASDNCKQYLDTLGSLIHTNKEGKLRGGVTQFTFATHDFYREDFESRNGITDRSTLCTS